MAMRSRGPGASARLTAALVGGSAQRDLWRERDPYGRRRAAASFTAPVSFGASEAEPTSTE
jgi:hypothetical protein